MGGLSDLNESDISYEWVKIRWEVDIKEPGRAVGVRGRGFQRVETLPSCRAPVPAREISATWTGQMYAGSVPVSISPETYEDAVEEHVAGWLSCT